MLIDAFNAVANDRERGLDLRGELLSRRGRRHASRGAIEQPDAQASLKLGDRLTQRRCRQAKFGRGGAKTPALCHRSNGFKLNYPASDHYPDFCNSE